MPLLCVLRFRFSCGDKSTSYQATANSKMKFLLACSCGPLHEFRLPELDSIATLYNFPITYLEGSRDTSVGSSPCELAFSELTCAVSHQQRPFIIIDLPSEEEARLLGSRAISVKHIWHYWAHADTYEQLHPKVVACKELWVSGSFFQLDGCAEGRLLTSSLHPSLPAVSADFSTTLPYSPLSPPLAPPPGSSTFPHTAEQFPPPSNET